jgi:predicted nucleic acid-binding protein
MTVVRELYFAVHASQRREQNLQRPTNLLNTFQVYPFDRAAAEEFGHISIAQRISQVPANAQQDDFGFVVPPFEWVFDEAASLLSR